MIELLNGERFDPHALIRPTVLGRLESVVGQHATVTGLDLAVGDVIEIGGPHGSGTADDGSADDGDGDRRLVRAEIVAVSRKQATALPFGTLSGLTPGSEVRHSPNRRVPVGYELLGRVLDGTGRPMDGRPLQVAETVSEHVVAPDPLTRPLVQAPLQVGVRAVDGLIPVGVGQRTGIFAGSGVGKSSLLSMLIRGTSAPVRVLALIGERGREVREFLERDLGPAGLAQSVVVVATAEQPAVVRRRAAFVATRIAEWFREQGTDVLLLMDSLTRFAMAHREIGLAAGEMPTSRGYPPSIPGMLSTLLERAGTTPAGSITGIYTVLVEGDDTDDPIGDTARSLLDGHIVLRRSLAEAGHFPAIDVLSSVSRVASSVTTVEEQRIMTAVRDILATEADVKDLVQVGAYQAGTDPAVDRALRLAPGLRAVLRQPMHEPTSRGDTFTLLADALRVEEILT